MSRAARLVLAHRAVAEGETLIFINGQSDTALPEAGPGMHAIPGEQGSAATL